MHSSLHRSRLAFCAVVALSVSVFGLAAHAASAPVPAYAAITPTMENKTITLTGHDLTIEQVIDIARHGAKVKLSEEAIERAEAGRGLLAQGDEEGMTIYGTNRGGGALREVVQKRDRSETPPPNRNPGSGARNGILPEINEEELVRAFIVIQMNHVAYNAGGRAFLEMVCEMLNRRVTPLMYSVGTLGEGDLFLTSNYTTPMYGRGTAYYKGVRMTGAEALQKAGLKPLVNNAGGGGGTTMAYGTAITVLLVDEAQHALEWTDMIYAMDLLGMNSSVTPLSTIVQSKHPVPWIKWVAAKTRETLKGTYLYEDDPHRILQDPESLRAGYIRQGSAWKAWAALRDSVQLQMNSGEQNPAVVLDAKPEDSWELATPWLMRYHVKGGELSKGRSGYVVSNANWDPYPMTNDIEAFNVAFANMALAVASRIERFSDRGPVAFFTGIKPTDVLTPEQHRLSPSMSEPFFNYLDAWKEMQTLTQSLVPDSNGSDWGVADIEANTRVKASRGRQATDRFMHILSYDLLHATYWLDVRKAQDAKRNFGAAATGVWQAFRKDLPWQMEPDKREDVPYGLVAFRFLMNNEASQF